MRIVRLANFVAPRSGGLRTTLAELGAGYLAAGHEPVLVMPGERDSDDPDRAGPGDHAARTKGAVHAAGTGCCGAGGAWWLVRTRRKKTVPDRTGRGRTGLGANPST